MCPALREPRVKPERKERDVVRRRRRSKGMPRRGAEDWGGVGRGGVERNSAGGRFSLVVEGDMDVAIVP
jgi:hypothetical protein